MITYRITYLAGILDTSTCPPAIVFAVFPSFNGEPVELTAQYCDVTFKTEQTPVDISPLIKVKQIL